MLEEEAYVRQDNLGIFLINYERGIMSTINLAITSVCEFGHANNDLRRLIPITQGIQTIHENILHLLKTILAQRGLNLHNDRTYMNKKMN